MNKASFLGISGILILGVSIAMASSQVAQADEPKPETVVNTPAVTIASMPNVAVTGTANVNVTSMPAVNVGSMPPVNVSSMPAVQIDGTNNHVQVDNAVAVRPVQFERVAIDMIANHDNYTVPAGKRLVIEQVYFQMSADPDTDAILMLNAGPQHYPLPASVQQNSVERFFTGAVATNIVAPENTLVYYSSDLSWTGGNVLQYRSVTLVGHYEPM